MDFGEVSLIFRQTQISKTTPLQLRTGFGRLRISPAGQVSNLWPLVQKMLYKTMGKVFPKIRQTYFNIYIYILLLLLLLLYVYKYFTISYLFI